MTDLTVVVILLLIAVDAVFQFKRWRAEKAWRERLETFMSSIEDPIETGNLQRPAAFVEVLQWNKHLSGQINQMHHNLTEQAILNKGDLVKLLVDAVQAGKKAKAKKA